MNVTLLDGPVGTELARRGARTDGQGWSSGALLTDPDLVRAIHRDYARAGATVHTANTFRTKRRDVGEAWELLARTAVRLAREAIPPAHRVAGSVAPLADCYRPDLSPDNPEPEHHELSAVLVDAGVARILVETLAHVPEAAWAGRAAARTGIEVWCALTAGFRADLLTPVELTEGARRAVDAGASAILVNCIPTAHTLGFVERLAGLGVRVGAYANGGSNAVGIGWDEAGPAQYARHARDWIDAGATIVGGCCGTGPTHIAAVAAHCGHGVGSLAP
ncbi:MAG: homocysteine S-methyltransferase family protein [Myxococcota bacterium]